MAEIEIVVPHGAFGANTHDDDLDRLMRDIGAKYGKGEDWPEKYGATFEDDVFMAHSYCWCERDDCPWCAGCDCPESAYHYLVDKKEVSYKQWMSFYDREVYAKVTDGEIRNFDQWLHCRNRRPGWEKAIEKAGELANKRRFTRHDPECPFCRGERWLDKGCEAGKAAPNFWYKPTNLKTWWYKYIGRGMETNRQPDYAELSKIRWHLLGAA